MIAAILALLLAQPLPGDGWHARYGPLTQCLAGYAVTVAPGEAVQADGTSVFLANADRWLRITPDSRHLYPGFPGTDVDIAGLGRIRRVSPPYRMRSPYDSGIVYLLPPADGGPALQVHSAAFNESAQDLVLLAAIRRHQGSEGCGDFRPPAWPGERADAAEWRPERRQGPYFHCQNGIGFRIGAGDSTRRPWLLPYAEPAVRIESGDVGISVHGPDTAAHGSGRVTAAYGATVESRWDGPNLVLWPPHQTSQPRTRRQMDAYARAYRQIVRIAFPAGQEAIARTFANRLEFVESTDPRCHGESTAS